MEKIWPKVTIKDLDESYTIVVTNDEELNQRLKNTFTVFEEGYQFQTLFRQGFWDGKVKLYKIIKGYIVVLRGLIDYVIKDLESQNRPYDYINKSTDQSLDFNKFETYVKNLGLPFEPYDYQISSAHHIITKKRSVQQAATGSGKSVILYMVIRWMLDNNHRTLLIVPTISLTLQMKSDFEEYGIENYKPLDDLIRVIGGESNEKILDSHPLTISTWQSLYRMNAADFEIFDTILVDECHTVKGDALQRIIDNAKNASWKVGVTGSVPRGELAKMKLLGTLGKVNKVITPQGLIDRGLATPVHIILINLKHKLDVYKRSKAEKWKYNEERNYLNLEGDRNNMVSSIVNNLANIGNTLVLFDRVEHGRILLKNAIFKSTNSTNFELLDKVTPKPVKEAIKIWVSNKECKFYINGSITKEMEKKIYRHAAKDLTGDDIELFKENIISLSTLNIYFIYGNVDGEAREDIRRILETIDVSKYKGATIIASYATTSTGVNYKNLHNIVLASGTKSFTRITQTIGRGMRKHISKEKVNLVDLIDIISPLHVTQKNYSINHFYERMEIYGEQGYPITEKYIDL